MLDGAPGERSASGLLEWESINDAMEALAMMNHYQMQNPSEYWHGLDACLTAFSHIIKLSVGIKLSEKCHKT